MQAVELAAAGVGGVWLLMRGVPWALRSLAEADRALRRATARNVRRRQATEAEPDLDALLLGPYLTPTGHHDHIADRWSVIADAVVVVEMERRNRWPVRIRGRR